MSQWQTLSIVIASILLSAIRPGFAEHKCHDGCISGSCQEGYGVRSRSDCTIYRGQWLDGKYHGLGTEVAPSGASRTGVWRNGLLETDSVGEASNWSIVPGIGYYIGFGSRNYISKAIVDAFGVVTVTERRQQITRLFPTINALYRPDLVKNWRCLPSNFALGFSLGVNEGVNNEGNGFALAMGFLFGVATTAGHFGLFIGNIADPSVKKLPRYLREGRFYPTLLDGSRTSGLSDALVLNQGIDIPLESVSANYLTLGFSYSLKFN